jgi:hypothetical protein
LFDGNSWDIRSKLYANAALIDWLIESVKPADADRLSGHNWLLQRALLRPGLAVPEALRELLVEEGLAGGESAPGGTILTPTAAGGAAYVSECMAAGVPIPPDWGTSQWVSQGPLTNEFILSWKDTEVFTYQSTSPAGMCIALPRSVGSSIDTLGIICLGQTSSNACFWDNQPRPWPRLRVASSSSVWSVCRRASVPMIPSSPSNNKPRSSKSTAAGQAPGTSATGCASTHGPAVAVAVLLVASGSRASEAVAAVAVEVVATADQDRSPTGSSAAPSWANRGAWIAVCTTTFTWMDGSATERGPSKQREGAGREPLRSIRDVRYT